MSSQILWESDISYSSWPQKIHMHWTCTLTQLYLQFREFIEPWQSICGPLDSWKQHSAFPRPLLPSLLKTFGIHRWFHLWLQGQVLDHFSELLQTEEGTTCSSYGCCENSHALCTQSRLCQGSTVQQQLFQTMEWNCNSTLLSWEMGNEEG